ncbi:uncharacterized protein I303_108526 [Kwoniella dejecticola CBS 10117]|uniref:Alpha-1,3-mannosyltransferase CMT1 n=1 Tax=Kwoniella dejecticola CBS 10117 TaxID=1296121 RepID=A0A1A5ZX60_9TREE|nr:alpha-1,3-mannosyltransferase CMT1 [Kwoniella dejecticola CBS 10117]OBR82391.1 alpha-1,3-mannosyltransferase CMT1 [Kwoniella dejecticola CBS 10117]
MLRSTSSPKLFRSLRGGRATSPSSPILHTRQSSRSPIMDKRNRLTLGTVLIVGMLFLISFFSNPNPSISHKFQIPGIFPSIPPATSIIVEDPFLHKIINLTSVEYSKICTNTDAPVYLEPALTPSQQRRYGNLRNTKGGYMLVTNTRQIENHLPDLLNTIIVLVNFLGKDKLFFSILEGPSNDCTPKILNSVLIPLLHSLGVPSGRVKISTDEPKINWSHHNRIEKIAELRNRALEPLWTEWQDDHIESIVFFNDVYLRASDILELLYQHDSNGASITTGMDWWKKKPEYYYDIWVGRTIDTGDLFYPIEWSWWTPSSDLFSNSPGSKKRYANLEPFQVFSSWNALAILSPKPFLPPHDVRFRRGDLAKGECAASECTLIASDFWKDGYGKVMVVPSVQLAYERDVAFDIMAELAKQKSGLSWVDDVPPKSLDSTVEWIKKPPQKVRCHPWPEVNGLSANVWETKSWVDPWLD